MRQCKLQDIHEFTRNLVNLERVSQCQSATTGETIIVILSGSGVQTMWRWDKEEEGFIFGGEL